MIPAERGVAMGLALAVLVSSYAFARGAGAAADSIDEIVVAEMASRRIRRPTIPTTRTSSGCRATRRSCVRSSSGRWISNREPGSGTPAAPSDGKVAYFDYPES